MRSIAAAATRSDPRSTGCTFVHRLHVLATDALIVARIHRRLRELRAVPGCDAGARARRERDTQAKNEVRQGQAPTYCRRSRRLARMVGLVSLVRAPWAHSSVHSLFALPDSPRGVALARVRRSTIDTVEDSFRLAWVEAELLIEIDEAIRSAMGADEYLAHCRRSIRRAFDWPLLSPLVQRAFGGGPSAFLRALPRGYGAVTRNCGVLRARLERGTGSIQSTGLPGIVCESESFLAGIQGAILACLDVARREGRVEEDRSRLADGVLRHSITWRE